MRLFVGLGNPGENYCKNRHNIGFMAVDAIINRHGGSSWKKKFQGLATEVTLNRAKLIFLRPSTFMNLCGQSVSEASRFYKLPSSEICVFHDELDLPFMKIKTKIGEVNNPAPASAIGIIGITEKYSIIEMTLKNVRKTIANQFFIRR